MIKKNRDEVKLIDPKENARKIQALLHGANVKMQKTMLHLNKVTGGNLPQTIIENKFVNQLHVLEGVPLYVKVLIKGNKLPCKISIDYG